jgi:hypothetical protein
MPRILWPAVLAVALGVATSVLHATPEATFLFPLGGTRGSTVELTLGGAVPQWPVGAWASDPHVEVVPLEASGRLQVKIGEQAQLGVVWLRFYDAQGAASPRPWIVGAGPEQLETEPNDRPDAAQEVALDDASHRTVTINGRLQQEGDADVYQVAARAGQVLVADLDAQAELASPMDGVLQVLRPDGFVVAQNDDQQKLDPRLAVPLPEDGNWMVRVFGFPEVPGQDVQLGGAETYNYRLTISTGPVVNYALPLAAQTGRANRWTIAGWNLDPEDADLTLTPPAESAEVVLQNGRYGRTIVAPVVAHDVLTESEPSSLEKPMTVSLPVSVTGQIDGPGDEDVYQFAVQPGKLLKVDVESRELGYPLDPVLELLDEGGQQIARVDDAGTDRDSLLTHAVSQEATWRLKVSDLHGNGGGDFVYRLSVRQVPPSFRLTSDAHEVVVKAGAKVELPIAVTRDPGFGGEISVWVEGLPASVEVAAQTSQVGNDSTTADKVVLSFAAGSEAPATSVPIRVVGKAGESTSSTAAILIPTRPACPAPLWLTVVPSGE